MGFNFSYLKNDIPAGIIVFLVAVPLCLGIALASGAPLFSGIIAGMVGGIVVGAISGSKLGVSGPAAGLAVIVADAIRQLGTNAEGDFSMEIGFPLFLSAVVIGGIVQILLAFLRAGIIGYYFPNSVIKGMLAAIGIIIFLKQIPHALGHDIIPDGFESFFQKDGENTFSEIWVAMGDINPAAVIISVISISILILWEQRFIKKIRLFQIIQGPLIVVVIGIIMSNFFNTTEAFTLAKDEMVNLPIASEEGGFTKLFTTPDWSRVFSSKIIITGITIAIVASLETLLCVEATDKIDPEKSITPTNRELIAQGVGNVFSGLIGGLPITQVIVRSSANIQSGGKTKVSAVFHGVLIFVSVMFAPQVMNMIPLSSLAAILFLVGYKLAKPSLFRQMSALGWEQFLPFIITIVGIVFTDLLVGIGIGLAVALFLILRKNFITPFNFRKEKEAGLIEIKLSENVTFLNKAGILQALNAVPANSKVLIDGTASEYIHPDVIEIIEDYSINAKTRNIELEVRMPDLIDKSGKDKIKLFKKKVRSSDFKEDSYFKTVFNS
ncbi:SulP family inorganic anion transporter [Marivirga atlantica]|jgi:MFS superfamily sulfate permease-like transporter|uniref:SulP family inorganic anion transporter n=2 Tax=Marivirga atlantica TaxID=1548457 RepID=A0A937ADX2_9BACT|nr:SulP family inorganic anion transporter [Marivirga atlantica]